MLVGRFYALMSYRLAGLFHIWRIWGNLRQDRLNFYTDFRSKEYNVLILCNKLFRIKFLLRKIR